MLRTKLQKKEPSLYQNYSVKFECLRAEDEIFEKQCKTKGWCMDQDQDCYAPWPEREAGKKAIWGEACMMGSLYIGEHIRGEKQGTFECCAHKVDYTVLILLAIVAGSIIWVGCGTCIAIKCFEQKKTVEPDRGYNDRYND